MATYYVGSGGNDGNDGLSWANRFLTLNGAEDEPVAANDTVYVGPGVYRELLQCDLSGSAGNEITYIGDVTGENTDGIGGLVRITGSDNDQTATRATCVVVDAFDYRVFRGFYMDMPSSRYIQSFSTSTNNTFEDRVFSHSIGTGFDIDDDNQSDWTFRRCVFISTSDFSPVFTFNSAAGVTNANHLFEDCFFIGGQATSVESVDVGGITINNCTFFTGNRAVNCASLPGGFTAITLNNCIINTVEVGLNAGVLGYIVEDYNTFWGNSTDRTNVSVGANSITYPPLFNPPILLDGFQFPWWFGELSEWSQVAAIAGTGESTEDLFGKARPATSAKKSWGAIQFGDTERETGTTRNSSTASIVLHDAARHQIFVPVTNVPTTISVYVYREADYAGTNPQLVVKQPGQADDTTVDAAAASQWNLLTTTLTPAVSPSYVIVELVSNNTAAATNFDVFFDDLDVS